MTGIDPRHDFPELIAIGDVEIDEEHAVLQGLIEHLIESATAMIDGKRFSDTFSDLLIFLLNHFQTEETFMRNSRMPAEEQRLHKREHNRLLDALHRINKDIVRARGSAAAARLDVCEVVRREIIDHIAHYDVNMKRYLVTKGPGVPD